MVVLCREVELCCWLVKHCEVEKKIFRFSRLLMIGSEIEIRKLHLWN